MALSLIIVGLLITGKISLFQEIQNVLHSNNISTPSCRMPSPRRHDNLPLDLVYAVWETAWDFEFAAFLTVFCLHLNQLEGSVGVFAMLSTVRDM